MEAGIKLLTPVDTNRHTDSQRDPELRREREGPHDRELVVLQATPSSGRSPPFAERMVPHRGPRNNRTGMRKNAARQRLLRRAGRSVVLVVPESAPM